MYTRMLCTATLVLAAFAAQAAPPAKAPPAPADQAKLQQEFEQLQQQMHQLGQRMGQLAEKMHADNPRVYAFRVMADPKRGTLGLVMMPTDKGLKVAGVTPGSSAEKAGVQAGDLIVSVDGKATASGKTPRRIDTLRDIKVGQKVVLKLDRDGSARTVTVTAQRNENADWPRALVERRMEWHDKNGGDVERVIIDARRKLDSMHMNHRMFFVNAPWWGLNLASLNTDLGSYFGTAKGALVLSGDSKRFPGLKAGDVITGVDGKSVDDPEDVMRALHEHKGKGEAKIALRRHNRTHTVMMKVPSVDAMLPPPPPPPPPAPPVPPTPPPGNIPPPPPAPPAPPVHSA